MSKTGKRFYFPHIFLLDVYAILIFLGITLLYFYPVLSGREIFIERDLSIFFIPPKYFWVHLVKTFQLPLWNPHSYAGIPLFATLQPGVLYPPNIFYLFLPFNVVWNWLIILHFMFAGITLYLLLRYLKASHLAALTGGITFMLSGYLISVHNLLNHLFSVVWSPLVLLFFLRYFETKRARYLVLSSLCLVMQFLAGAPEIVMITGFAMCVIIFFLKDFIDQEVRWSDRFKAFSLVLLMFVLVSSIQLIPFCELHFNSVRKGGLPYNEAITWSFAWRDFIQFFIPDFFGYFSNIKSYWLNQTWLKTLYLGIMPFFLSILYFVSKDRRKWVFLLLMGFSFFLAMGGNNPLYKYLYQIPPFSSIRYPAKFLYLFFFMIAVTCGLGLDILIKGVEEKSHKVKALIGIAFYCGFLFAVGWGVITLFREDVYRFLDIYGIKPDGYNDINKNIHN
ncbi:MAG: YfhO family protein, partial [Deltaproteobacteria bacterium]